MKTYQFKTAATMKPYNCKKWWISSDIIPTIEIKAENLKKALILWRDQVEQKHFVSISDKAIKHPEPMYVDTENEPQQVGYVITGKTDFDNDRRGWVTQYIDLWVSVDEIKNPFKEETNND